MTPEARAAFDAAVRILAGRAHGRTELRRKLAQRKHGSSDIGVAFERLEELGYLEEEADLAQRYAGELARRRGATPRAVAHKLRERGFAEDLSARAVDHAFEGWNPREAALQAVQGETDPEKAARKLTRKGFTTDAVVWVVGRLRSRREDQ
ncbi:MAG: RecX family transcriptional regulator [Myxococcota bacterium]